MPDRRGGMNIERRFAPDYPKCIDLLRAYDVGERVFLHSLAVGETAVWLAQRLSAAGAGVDVGLVMAGALLHDIGKGVVAQNRYAGPGTDHAQVSSRVVEELGYTHLCNVVRRHMLEAVLDPSLAPVTIEEKIVWYADKSTHFRYLTLERRLRELGARHSGIDEILERVLPIGLGIESELFSKTELRGLNSGLLRRLMSRKDAGRIPIGFWVASRRPQSVLATMRRAHAAGYNTVSLFATETALDRDLVLTEARGMGLRIHSLRTSARGSQIASADEGLKSMAVRSVLKTCELAVEIGAEVVILEMPKPADCGAPLSAVAERARLSIRQILRETDKKLCLALRNAPDLEADRLTRKVLNAVSDPRCGVCYNSANAALLHADIDYFACFGDRILVVEAHDIRHKPDERLAPYSGIVDWAGFVSQLGRARYRGPVFVTAHPAELPTMRALGEAFTAADRLLAESDGLGYALSAGSGGS